MPEYIIGLLTLKNYLLVLGLVFTSLTVQAQQAASLPPTPKAEYVSKGGEVLPSAEGAAYQRRTELQNDSAGFVRTYYLDDKPHSVSYYENVERRIQHGISKGWYKNGQLSFHSEYSHGKPVGIHEGFHENGKLMYRQGYVNGKREGEMVLYYPDGQLKRQEAWVDNKRTTGVCFNPQGQEIPFFEYEVLPKYPGGQEGLLQYIGRTTRYPGKALRRGIEGRVLIKFVVDSTGLVQRASVANKVDPLLDAEALRVVRGLARFEPGRQDGRAVMVYYTVPITFAIKQEPLFRRRPPKVSMAAPKS
ncbi:TonB family protein [Hymenobacter sediminis]|uniref:energy transducer TonB n=1 Tax=Hymenobacter sediminis TaxID=2218621 RepID=UPI000DA64C51|nr:energy transducer TonB [Hymenobacter sediminis]RPD45881.1 TonB family protein [Hymenobacter sediminis]